ncbi:MAG: EF-P 5-aminopentanol modification-associated protein YfmF [Candidatus Merdivicinus sp.]
MNSQYPLRREKIAEGVWFGSIADSRFKSNLLTVNLVLPLAKETVTENALIPLVLEKCWAEAPTNRQFSRCLNRLYGASVNSSTVKIGSAEVLTLSFSAIDRLYALHQEDLLKEGARILLGLLLQPVLRDGLLEPENLALQKQFLMDTIQADINEKRSYAIGQTVKRMFEGEVCGLPRNGFYEEVAKITPQIATNAWKRILDQSRIEILHVGMGDPSAAKQLFADAFASLVRHPLDMPALPSRKAPDIPREITEMKPVAQAKLCMGFQTGVNAYSSDLSAMRLMTALLGGTPTSRLFVHVREEQSLCYYCAARSDRFLGTLLVDSGIERENASKVQEAVLKEIEAIRRGDFTDEEVEFARLSLQNTYQSVGDSVHGLDAFYLTQTLLGISETPEEQGQHLEAVTREQICEAAQKLQLDTVYLLEGPGKGEVSCEKQ